MCSNKFFASQMGRDEVAKPKIGQNRRVERDSAFKLSRKSRRHMEISCHTLSHSRKSRTGLLDSHLLDALGR